MIIFACVIMQCFSLGGYGVVIEPILSTASRGVDDDLVDLLTAVDVSLLQGYIEQIQQFGPHPTGSVACEQVRDYVYHELCDMGLSVELLPWQQRRYYGENIEAVLPGHGSAEGSIILCAHYDSVSVSPGADDDGSGVASVLAAAHVLRGLSFNCTVKFVLFSGEEQGLLGSSVYAENAREREDTIFAVINLDGVGYAASRQGGHIVRGLLSTGAVFIQQFGNQVTSVYGDLVNLSVEWLPNEPISDHQSFVDQGYDTCYFFEKETNPFYHTSEDRLEHMNMSYLVKVARLTVGSAVLLAELDRNLADDDIYITMLGSVLSRPNQLQISVGNKQSEEAVNVTIRVEMWNRITQKYIEGPYDTICNWTITTEIRDMWMFTLAHRTFSKGLVDVSVRVYGNGDNVGLYQEKHGYGFVLTRAILLFRFV